MKHRIKLVTLSALFAAVAATGLVAVNVLASENDAVQLSAAKIDIKQATTIAEKKYDGKAASVEFNHDHGKAMYEVEVVSGKTVRDVLVDGNTGRIVEAKVDKPDADEEDDEEK